jgi:malonyl-CoA decarboxylase
MNMTFLQELFNSITRRDALRRRRNGEPITPDHTQLLDACRALLESDGEASSITLASRALAMYHRLEDAEKRDFFEGLVTEFAAEPAQIDTAYEAYRQARDNRTLQALFSVCEPRRQELFRRLNLASDGTYQLVRMREDLLAMLREQPRPEAQELDAVDQDFAHLFGSWFNRGFLVLKRIDWNTPASILEKIIRYEAVHEIQDWNDLRRRLDARDRRCFAFFHPAIGDEPLIFVEVALHKGLPEQIQPILEGERCEIDDPEAADTAAFFGISNCQTGLRGISFGNFLIKQVVQELKQELPQLRHFVTLSPVPGFRQWLASCRDDDTLPEELRDTLAELDTPGWHHDAQCVTRRRPGDRVAVQVEKSPKRDALSRLPARRARSSCRSTPPTRPPRSNTSSATPSRPSRLRSRSATKARQPLTATSHGVASGWRRWAYGKIRRIGSGSLETPTGPRRNLSPTWRAGPTISPPSSTPRAPPGAPRARC